MLILTYKKVLQSIYLSTFTFFVSEKMSDFIGGYKKEEEFKHEDYDEEQCIKEECIEQDLITITEATKLGINT